MERAAVLLERQKIPLGLIGFAVFPAAEINTHQFESQRTAGLVVFIIVLRFVLLIKTLGPRLLFESAGGVFMEGLPAELGTTVAHVDGFGAATLLDERSDPIELRHFGRAAKALPIGAKGDQESRRQGRTCARPTANEGRIGVLVHGVLDLLVHV